MDFFDGIDVIQLQTFEQLFYNNFSKIKNSFRKFKGLSKDSLIELRHIEGIQKTVDLINKYYFPKQNLGSSHGQVLPSDELRLQFSNLKASTSEILLMYKDGIESLKTYPLHPKL